MHFCSVKDFKYTLESCAIGKLFVLYKVKLHQLKLFTVIVLLLACYRSGILNRFLFAVEMDMFKCLEVLYRLCSVNNIDA